tara:strand:- start:122 stop:415 length:294 start_codon:yes stop_codon:yes gene_type:complete
MGASSGVVEFRARKSEGRDCPAAESRDANVPHLVPRKFSAVAKVLWPNKTALCLADIARTNERTAKRWLRGEHEPPLSVVLAVIHEMLREQTELNLR